MRKLLITSTQSAYFVSGHSTCFTFILLGRARFVVLAIRLVPGGDITHINAIALPFIL